MILSTSLDLPVCVDPIPNAVRDQIIELALDDPEFSSRELVTALNYKISINIISLCLLLSKSHDLISADADIVVKAAYEFRDTITTPNQMWQTDFAYL